jgi:predicted DNA-binding transcriptional regulator AlpA
MTTGETRPQNINVIPFKTACETANLSVSTMRRLIQAGRGPRLLKLSTRRIGIRHCDLDRWLAERSS